MRYFLLLSVVLLVGCNRHGVKITGNIDNAENALLTVEKVMIGQNQIIDSVRLKARGKFSFSSPLQSSKAFFQLRLDSLQPVLLLVSEGERVNVIADAQQFENTLQVSGSKESEGLLQLQKSLWTSVRRADSVIWADIPEKEMQRQVSKIFVAQKQTNARFIMQHAGSLATVIAFYQKLGDALPLFGTVDDRFLLATVLDSLRRHYPKSLYITVLEQDLEKRQQEASRRLLQAKIDSSPVLRKPEIALRDVGGKMQSLSALAGNVVLLQFWSTEQKDYHLDTRELRDVYSKFSGRRFKIYRVALDTDSVAWRDAVSGLPAAWINVCSFRGAACPAARNYNVTTLPSNFLINKKGDIVAKNVFDDELQKQISKLLQTP
jgi:peroxiredoxin